jgi:hypothetical protein
MGGRRDEGGGFGGLTGRIDRMSWERLTLCVGISESSENPESGMFDR